MLQGRLPLSIEEAHMQTNGKTHVQLNGSQTAQINDVSELLARTSQQIRSQPMPQPTPRPTPSAHRQAGRAPARRR